MSIPVYVDSLQTSQGSATAGRTFAAGRQFCHLTAANLSPESIDALHSLAARIGLRRAWFQPQSWPHYDLTPPKRAAAVAAGAVEETPKEGAMRRIKARKAGCL